MKFALHNELPGEAQVRQLIDSITSHPAGETSPAYDAYCRSHKVIAAYDQGKLIGLGRVTGETGDARIELSVLPDYQNRDIERYMSKLLQASSRNGSPTCEPIPSA